MMIRLQRYGITLRQISEDDIEQVRVWRNSPEVSQFMAYREEITPEMQARWFTKVEEEGDLYFIINSNGIDVGVINLRDIDIASREAEMGIFIAAQSHQNSFTSFKAALCLYDFAFGVMRLKRLKAQILDDNKRAIRFNRGFGYESSEILNGINRTYFLTKKDYETKGRPAFLSIVRCT
jgi:UDP-4-amino-4,6-dideoxy-N-acetyl-beta-L-altrosamine N-acetyltransferase